MDTCGYFTLLTGVMYVICIFGHENIGVFHLHPYGHEFLLGIKRATLAHFV